MQSFKVEMRPPAVLLDTVFSCVTIKSSFFSSVRNGGANNAITYIYRYMECIMSHNFLPSLTFNSLISARKKVTLDQHFKNSYFWYIPK